jgi:pimeloyl-ACP methyl ester carboxylesterase
MPYCSAARQQFHYRDEGSGDPVLFVHGFPLDGTMWLEQIERASPRVRCIAPDLRGFGLSDPSTDRVLTMERHADDLAAIMDAFGVDGVDLVGHSMGGYVALAFAERHPERIRTLALVNSKSTADSEEAKAGRDMTAIKTVIQGRAVLAREMANGLLADEASPWHKARVETMVEETRVETIVAALEGMKQRPDRTAVLESLAVPMVAIVGEEDRLTPVVEAETMVATVSDGTTTVIPGAGHMAPIENPDAVAAALAALWERVESRAG